MIILDEEPPSSKISSYSHVAGPTLRFPDRVACHSTTSLSLPDYETSQALANNDLVYKKVVNKKVDTRFWRATLYALIIYIALSVVIGIPILVTKLKRREHRYPPPPPPPPWQDSVEVDSDFSSPLYLDNLLSGETRCNSWMSTYNSGNSVVASSKYNASRNGFFSIRTNLSDEFDTVTGNLMVGMNPDQKSKDAVLSITMQASSADAQKATNVCFSKVDDACDLLILVPDELGNSDWLRFNISLLFPRSADPYLVDKLATWLPVFSQVFGKMDEQLTFDTVSIEGLSSQFDAGYIQANNLLVRTSMAEIKGKFRVNESLTLNTVEAPINATVTLVNDWRRNAPTYLTLDNGNGAINAQITLLAPPPPHYYHPNFLTSAKTFNATLKVTVKYDNTTLPSEFLLRTQNYLAASHITLDPKYEGTFDIQTKLSSAVVEQHAVKSLVDPLGENRQRYYQYDYMSSTRIFGWVGWGKRPGSPKQNHQGHVEVMSSHSPVELQLNGAGTQIKDNG